MSLSIYRCAPLLRASLPLFQAQNFASLYAAAALGIDRYVETRNKVGGQFTDFAQKYREKMKDFVGGDSQNMVFTDDLKNMIHLATKEDAELLDRMIRKFNGQKHELKFGNFIFGPVVMRMYHYLDMPDEAMKLFVDPETNDFFNQLASQQVLMDLLFKHERYDDILKVFEVIENTRTTMVKYSRNVIILVLASCYKQNTKESFEYATKLWSRLIEAGHEPLRRSITYVAALAINHGAPHIALEVLSPVREQRYVSVLNLKAMALSDLDRPEDAIPILRNILDSDTPSTVNCVFLEETLEKLKKSVERTSNLLLQKEFELVQKGLINRNYVQNSTIDSILTQQINYTINRQAGEYNRRDQRENTFDNTRRPINRHRRLGLQDMA